MGPRILLLAGPSGVGKTMYCRQFLLEGLVKGDRCMFISTDLSKMQFNALFSNIEDRSLVDSIEFINQYEDEDTSLLSSSNEAAVSGKRLAARILSTLERRIEISSVAETRTISSNQKTNGYGGA
ncbi:MAG TPA: ATPase domain-containing protein, partial [Nitrososphaera sp.]|nr:ATPase domain-containing protein [Nitrososphaera sp.]